MADTTANSSDKLSKLLLHDNGDNTYSVSAILQNPSSSASYAVKSAAGGAAAITLAASAGVKYSISHIVAGYDAAPAAGATLTITDDSAVVFQIPVTAAGPLFVPVNIQSAVANKAMVITLSAGGGAVLAYVNVPGARTE
jgi:hypothetical protein